MHGLLYDLLLRAYPRRFRERNAAEMRRFFLRRLEDAGREGGRLAVGRLWIRTIIDFGVNAPPERVLALSEALSDRGYGTGAAVLGREGVGGGMDALLKDVRYGMRSLAKNPTFTLIAVLTIGLGIGANTAIFSVVRAVLLKPLPYEDPSELVMVWSEMTARDVQNFPLSPPVLEDLRANTEAFEELAGIIAFQQPLMVEGQALQLEVGNVSHTFFEILGVNLLMGRDFTVEDATPVDGGQGVGIGGGFIAPTVTILSHATWQTFFGGDPQVLGRTMDLGGASVEIIGVLPPDFEPLFPPTSNVSTDVALWVTPRFDLTDWNPANVMFPLVGRLAEGVSMEQAQAELDRASERWALQVPVFATAGNRYYGTPLHDDLTADVRPVMLALLGAVGFVLLIACANVANLLLVRSATREREMAVRAAMGGSRGRLIRQMLVESALLAGAGAGLGLVLAQGGIGALISLQPDNLPRLDAVAIDGVVLAFTLLASLLAAVLFGLVPALQGSRMQLADVLKDRGKASSASRNRLLRNGVVVGEVALSVVLLVGAGLMLRSFAELQSVDPGYETENMLTLQAPLPGAAYPAVEDRVLAAERIQREIEALPGVESVSSIFPALLNPLAFNGRYGTAEALEDESFFRQGAYKVVLPGFFETVGARLVAGRFLNEVDQADSAAVVVVDRKLAEMTFPGRSAVGERILTRFFTNEPLWVEIVGVVENMRHETLSREARETIFFNDHYVGGFGGGTWIVRSQNPTAQVDPIRDVIASIDPTVPISDVRTLESYVTDDIGPTRFALTLIAVFGITALILASVGLYGVLASVVRQRTAEIGVRMAFGAERSSILGLVVRQGLGLAVIGLVVGLAVAFGVTGVMESLLVGVAPADPLTFGVTAAVFLAVATLSCLVPARRATRVDPVVALRDE